METIWYSMKLWEVDGISNTKSVNNRGCNDEFEARAIGVLKVKVSLIYTPNKDTKLTSIASELFALSHRPPLSAHLQNLQLKNTPKSTIGFHCPDPHTDCMQILAMQVVRGIT